MLRRLSIVIALAASLGRPLAAQHASGDSSLLTVDRIFASPEFRGGSLSALAWLSDGAGYTALNGVMKDAAARRLAIRQQMQASGGFTPGQEPTPAQRAKFDSVRTEMEGFQAEADQWYAAIRNNLTAAQQVKFDALPKPRVMGRMGGGPPRQ